MDYIRVYRKAAYYRESFGYAVFDLSTWSLLCDGRLLTVVVILFQFLASLRVHSVEGGY